VDGDSSDEQLLAAYRGGDVRAFERLLARYEKPIWSFLRRFVRDAEAAEDLLQEVFLRVVRDAQASGPAWKGEAKFSTWLYTIARNLCIDRARRTAVRGSASASPSIDGSPDRDGDAETATLHERIAAPGPSTDAVVAGRQAAGRIDRAVAELPDDQREVFLMREVMELPFAEIASLVGVPEPTVKSRMRYALEKLRAALADLGDAGEGGKGGSGAAESTGSG
jgi:RNA polymerase sigma-70 factor (ECF subfamily)